MTQPVISMFMWASLPNDVRSKLRATFKIPRSSHVVVNDGRLETDGTTHEDLKHLTVEKMQAYINSDSTDFHKLFDAVIEKMNEPVIVVTPGLEIAPASLPKRGRPSKKNAHEKV